MLRDKLLERDLILMFFWQALQQQLYVWDRTGPDRRGFEPRIEDIVLVHDWTVGGSNPVTRLQSWLDGRCKTRTKPFGNPIESRKIFAIFTKYRGFNSTYWFVKVWQLQFQELKRKKWFYNNEYAPMALPPAILLLVAWGMRSASCLPNRVAWQRDNCNGGHRCRVESNFFDFPLYIDRKTSIILVLGSWFKAQYLWALCRHIFIGLRLVWLQICDCLSRQLFVFRSRRAMMIVIAIEWRIDIIITNESPLPPPDRLSFFLPNL